MDKKKKASVVISVTLRQGMFDQLNKTASRFDININKLIGNYISLGLDELNAFKRYRILNKIFFIQNILRQFGIDIKKNAEDKVKHERSLSMSVRISEELNKGIEQWAAELKRPKNSIIETCIGLSIDVFNALDVGRYIEANIAFAKAVERVEEFIKDKRSILKMWKERAEKAQRISEKMLEIDT